MIIELSNVSWEREEQILLTDLSWEVKEHEHWTILGLNGSGKTTLLQMINGYIWPTAGTISVLGQMFGQYDLRELRKSIGWVSSSLQEKLYGEEDVLSIVLSGKYSTIGVYDHIDDDDRVKAAALLHAFGCEALKGRSYNRLSQGERQRVLIARALMNDPKLLILDEPCTGLDLLAREKLLTLIQELAQSPSAPTLIYVTHHVEEILPCFKKTLLLKEGRVYAAEETEAILTEDRLSVFFGIRVEMERRDGRHFISVIKDQ